MNYNLTKSDKLIGCMCVMFWIAMFCAFCCYVYLESSKADLGYLKELKFIQDNDEKVLILAVMSNTDRRGKRVENSVIVESFITKERRAIDTCENPVVGEIWLISLRNNYNMASPKAHLIKKHD